jgi:hypothetical protein
MKVRYAQETRFSPARPFFKWGCGEIVKNEKRVLQPQECQAALSQFNCRVAQTFLSVQAQTEMSVPPVFLVVTMH